MPDELASALTGQAVDVEVHPEVPAGTRLLDLNDLPDGLPFLVGDDGIGWNGYWPACVFYTDASGRTWRLPRHWLTEGVSPVIDAGRYEVTQESSWLESWCPPTWWDLRDVNIRDMPAAEGERGAGDIEVSVAPGEIPKAFWRGPSGRAWSPARLAQAARQAARPRGAAAERLAAGHSGGVRGPNRRREPPSRLAVLPDRRVQAPGWTGWKVARGGGRLCSGRLRR
ncbi:MAG: hypothetical protein ABSF46_22570 [Terriglobia bacterium]